MLIRYKYILHNRDLVSFVIFILLGVYVTLCIAGILDWNTGRSDNKIEVTIPWLPFENETRCYAELGCINITRDWYHLIYRPLNVFPLPRQVINTQFILYTRKNPNLGQILKVQSERSIQKSNFDPKKETKMIIHGFLDTPLSSWVKDMKKELLKRADWNIIVIDWSGGSLPLYTQATANTRLVGLEIAYFINYLIENHGLKAKDVHMIGHSLGAHTAGYAGEKIEGLLRITGLDPAEPYFQGMPEHVRLDSTDAELVDVIHTDGSSIFLLGYGMSEPTGHIDFYPNNGKEQPGCDLSEAPLPLTLVREGIEEASRVLVACNHVRAIKLFTESINSKCPYIAHRCSSYQSFLQGKCFSCGQNKTECSVMGLDTFQGDHLNPGSRYYIITGKEIPYCRRHYRIALDLARPPRAENWVQGFIKMTLYSEHTVVRNINLTPGGYEKLEHGTTHNFLITHAEDVGKIHRVEFYWEYDMDVLQPRSICFLWCNDHLYVSSIHITEAADFSFREKREIQTNSKLCSVGLREYADIASRTSAVFVDDCDYDII